MKRWAIVVALGMVLGCNAEPAPTLEIVRALQPGSDCSWSIDNESWDRGWFDPKAASSMELHLELKATLGEEQSVNLRGFDICYGVDERTDCGSLPDGASVAGYRAFVSSAASLDEVARLDLFEASVQQSLFGEDFSAQAISVWFQQVDDNPCCRFFVTDLFLMSNEDRACCEQAEWNLQPLGGEGEPRAPGWGTFEQSTLVTMSLRAVGESGDGKDITSSWFSFPTELCVGCSLSHHELVGCDSLVGEFCDYGICHLDEGDYGEGETAPCTAEGCPLPEKPCYQYSYQLGGQRADVQGCVPAQLQGVTQWCVEAAGCGG